MHPYMMPGVNDNVLVVPPEARILSAVYRLKLITATKLMSGLRTREIAEVRHLIFYLMFYYTKVPLTEIGRLMGGYHWSTVIHGRDFIGTQLTYNKYFIDMVESVKKAAFLNEVTRQEKKSHDLSFMDRKQWKSARIYVKKNGFPNL